MFTFYVLPTIFEILSIRKGFIRVCKFGAGTGQVVGELYSYLYLSVDVWHVKESVAWTFLKKKNFKALSWLNYSSENIGNGTAGKEISQALRKVIWTFYVFPFISEIFRIICGNVFSSGYASAGWGLGEWSGGTEYPCTRISRYWTLAEHVQRSVFRENRQTVVF